MTQIIHFVHGNGFPSSCYKQLFHRLGDGFIIKTLECVGHNKCFPVTDNWSYLADEVVDSIRKQSSSPVIAMGHSLGGILSAMAAVKAPELIKSVLLLDSPLFGRTKSSLIKLIKVTGMIEKLTPAGRTLGRQSYWKSKEAVERYLRSRELFKHFTPACLDDYIHYGMVKTKEGHFSLRFDKQVEYAIYKTIPHTLPLLRKKLKVPHALVYGVHSDIIRRLDLRSMERHFQTPMLACNGGHLFPMESPDEAAQKIHQLLTYLN